MADGFVLFNYRLVSLAVFVSTRSVAPFVQEKLGLIEVFLLTSNQV